MGNEYYVAGCVDNGLSDEVVEDEHAEFWTLYARDASGESQGIIDCVFREDAVAAMAVYVDRDEWERKATSNFEECMKMDEQVRALAAELKRRDAQEPVAWRYRATNLFGDLLDGWKFSETESLMGLYQPLYAAVPAVALLPEMTMTDCVKRQLDTEFMAGYNQAISDAKALGYQPEKVVQLPSKAEMYSHFDTAQATINCTFNSAIDLCADALDAAGVKWE